MQTLCKHLDESRVWFCPVDQQDRERESPSRTPSAELGRELHFQGGEPAGPGISDRARPQKQPHLLCSEYRKNNNTLTCCAIFLL